MSDHTHSPGSPSPDSPFAGSPSEGSSRRRVEVTPEIGFEVWTHGSPRPGPHVVVLGGVHGDEIEGVVGAGRVARETPALSRGRLSVVPICHEVAFAADSRTSPTDGGNLARVFPGDPTGTATPQLADAITRHVLSDADLLIDLHTSGRTYDMPFLAGYRGYEPGADDSLASRAAHVFGADFVWRHPQRAEGRTLSVVDQGIYVECPGAGPTDLSYVAAYFTGVMRVLGLLEMIDAPPAPRATAPQLVVGGGDMDRDMISVTTDGLFIRDVQAGDPVTAGQRVGTVCDTGGVVLEEVFSPTDGYVMALKRRPPVTQDDLVANLSAVETDA